MVAFTGPLAEPGDPALPAIIPLYKCPTNVTKLDPTDTVSIRPWLVNFTGIMPSDFTALWLLNGPNFNFYRLNIIDRYIDKVNLPDDEKYISYQQWLHTFHQLSSISLD